MTTFPDGASDETASHCDSCLRRAGGASVLWLQPSIGQPVPKTVKAALPFGLAGDGRTDDADALQRAVDSGVGSIHLPKGDFLIGKTIVVNLDRTGYTAFTGDGTAKIIMSGAGPAIRFVGTHDGTADPASFKPAVWIGSERRWFKGSRSSAPTNWPTASRRKAPCN